MQPCFYWYETFVVHVHVFNLEFRIPMFAKCAQLIEVVLETETFVLSKI